MFTVVDSPGGARYRRPSGGPSGAFVYVIVRDSFNVKDFGAVGDGSANDTVAVQNAVTAAANANGSVYFPQGTYLISSALTLPGGFAGHISVFGDGEWVSVIVQTGTGNGLDFDLTGGTYPYKNTVEIYGLGILANNAAASGYAIGLKYPTGGTAAEMHTGSSVRHVYIGTVVTGNYTPANANAGWKTGIKAIVACHLEISDVYLYGNFSNWYGSGAGSGSGVDLLSCINCNLDNVSGAFWNTGLLLENAGGGTPDPQGILISNLNFVSVGTLMNANGTGNMAVISLTNWQCDNGETTSGHPDYNNGIIVTDASDVVISGGTAIFNSNQGSPALKINGCTDVLVSGNKFYTSANSSQAVWITGSTVNATINGNRILATGTSSVGLTIDSGCVGIINTSNNYRGSTTALVDNGTATISANNQ